MGRRVAALALIAAVSLAACDDGSSERVDGLEATGVVVDVQGTLTEVESFELLLDNGSRLTFVPEDGALERAGFSPAHLREHAALVQPIAVVYVEEDGSNVAVGFEDADG
jgi:hypothetical protein